MQTNMQQFILTLAVLYISKESVFGVCRKHFGFLIRKANRPKANNGWNSMKGIAS